MRAMLANRTVVLRISGLKTVSLLDATVVSKSVCKSRALPEGDHSREGTNLVRCEAVLNDDAVDGDLTLATFDHVEDGLTDDCVDDGETHIYGFPLTVH